MKPTLKAPGTKRLKLKCDEPLSNFAFNFNLRRYTMLTSLWCYGNPGLMKLPESLAKAPSLKHIWAEGCGLHLEAGAYTRSR
jgi:hypothetical protein